jgi:hypothetical protein
MAKIGRKPADYELIEGGTGGGRSGGGSLRGGGGSSAKLSMDTKVLDGSLVGLSAAKAAGAAGMAVGQQERRDKAANRDMVVTRTETMRRAAAKPKDESARHYKGMANSTKQK